MSLSQYDPRDVALWSPGPISIERPETGRFNRPDEAELILQTLAGREASRKHRSRPHSRMRLFTAAVRNT